jgi:hypothetical protein
VGLSVERGHVGYESLTEATSKCLETGELMGWSAGDPLNMSSESSQAQ